MIYVVQCWEQLNFTRASAFNHSARSFYVVCSRSNLTRKMWVRESELLWDVKVKYMQFGKVCEIKNLNSTPKQYHSCLSARAEYQNDHIRENFKFINYTLFLDLFEIVFCFKFLFFPSQLNWYHLYISRLHLLKIFFPFLLLVCVLFHPFLSAHISPKWILREQNESFSTDVSNFAPHVCASNSPIWVINLQISLLSPFSWVFFTKSWWRYLEERLTRRESFHC